MATSFMTAAIPLRELLEIKNFAFDIPLYQRPYQWNHVQTKQLLRDLHQGYLEHSRHPDRAHSVLLGNVVLLHQDKHDFQRAAQSRERCWWPVKGPKDANIVHHCDVIDGQQRLTTLCILFAALQHKLLENSEEKCTAIAKCLQSRFSSERLLLNNGSNLKIANWFGMYAAGPQDLTRACLAC